MTHWSSTFRTEKGGRAWKVSGLLKPHMASHSGPSSETSPFSLPNTGSQWPQCGWYPKGGSSRVLTTKEFPETENQLPIKGRLFAAFCCWGSSSSFDISNTGQDQLSFVRNSHILAMPKSESEGIMLLWASHPSLIPPSPVQVVQTQFSKTVDKLISNWGTRFPSPFAASLTLCKWLS